MRIRGLFCSSSALTNEDYRKVLKDRNKWMIALIITGMAAAATAFWANESKNAAISEEMLGVYGGFGIGIALAGIILFIKNLILLRDERKLKESRLNNTDERLEQISSKAIKTALKIMMLATVAGGLLGGIFYPILVKAVIFILYVFFFSYMIAFRVYQRKM